MKTRLIPLFLGLVTASHLSGSPMRGQNSVEESSQEPERRSWNLSLMEHWRESGLRSNRPELQAFKIVPDLDAHEVRVFQEKVESNLPLYLPKIYNSAAQYDFDWRLVAAVMYQESHFDPEATSYTGVRGLMQLTLPTARDMEVADRLNPEQSIHGGIRYLAHLRRRFAEIDGFQRILFTLGSYNLGYGHILDAQALARARGGDPDRWENVRTVLPLLEQERHYSRTQYGHARGTEAATYVMRICNYFVLLKRRECLRHPNPGEWAEPGVPPEAEGFLTYSSPQVCGTRNCRILLHSDLE